MPAELSARRFAIIAWSMTAVAVVVYLHNVIVFPGLRAPDGFGHFTYIWALVATGAVPLATAGWSFFHPPLYYAFMAGVWQALPNVDPALRLEIGTGLIALMGIAQAGVAWLIVRRCLPHNRMAQLLAIGVMLFLPIHVFSAGYLGNERFNAVLCGTSLLVLVWTLERPVWWRAIILGVTLGLAMLVKFTALAIVAGSFATIGGRFLAERQILRGIRISMTVGIVMLSVCGWFYLNNFLEYGTPFKLSRDTEMVQHIENYQTTGERGLLEYVLFDPLIITSPQWPRGLPLFGEVPPDAVRSPLRESVWTGIYANAWFDGVGGTVIPPIKASMASLRAGQLILTLALVPTALVFIGLAAAIRRLWRDGWHDVYAGMLVTFAAMMTVFIYGTLVVPMHAAVKASYVTPISVIFAFWIAIGFDSLQKRRPGLARCVVGVSGLLAVASVTVFYLDGPVGRGYLTDGSTNRSWQNLYGIVQYAGGNKAQAREMFEEAAAKNSSLAQENVAAMAMDAGDPMKAIGHLRAAARWQPLQSFGRASDRRRFDNAWQAELSLLLAVAYHEAGMPSAARKFATNAVQRGEAIPEAHYNLGMLYLIESLSLPDEDGRKRDLVAKARRQFQTSAAHDAAFRDAVEMTGVAMALQGDCRGALDMFERAETATAGARREYPHATGTGNMHSAAIHRRRQISDVPEALEVAFQRARCAAASEQAGK